ncbi:PIN domain protein [Pelotomaculum schinkii]|uniref:PIN domain protein n=1 Tax=Pelotomaculum schinkii TaxID=78350 RepID=A0A4Y7RGJ2_9FIRM|nr:PIN domain-containing protein [Pelotomaculum schinkii]TEB07901.1 PIN domain protein [Pelotomaculum schinkii]
MKRSKVFLDSSVIIAGLASKKGGAYEVLVLSELGIVIPCISEDVVSEVLRNVQKKLPNSLAHYYALFKTLPFKILDASEKDMEYAKGLINEKDAPILASAISGSVDWLLSLDKHFLNIDGKEKLDFVICSPGNFLKKL